MLIVLLFIFGFSVTLMRMQKLSEADTAMYELNTLAMADLAILFDSVASQRICLTNAALFLAFDPAFSAAELADLNNKEALFSEAFANYKNSILDDAELVIYNNIKSSYEVAFAVAKTAVKGAIASGNEGTIAAAIKQLDNAGAGLSDYVDEAFAFNEKLADDTVLANQALFVSTRNLSAISNFGCAVLAIALALTLTSIVSKPVGRIMQVANQAGQLGDYNFDPQLVAAIKQDAHYQDEVGQTAASFASMMDSIIDKLQVLDNVADGDLTASVPLIGPRDTFGNTLVKMMDNLNGMFGEINLATDQVSSGSAQIAMGAQSLAQASTEQAASVDLLSGSIRDMAEKTAQNTQRAGQATGVASTIRRSAEEGSFQMQRMTEAVQQINEASKSISAIIKVIDDIAFQTNILALNAAVEAARAGQHGKGFAVVAEEVRSLAGKSANAAKDTGTLIANSVEKAELGARIAMETSAALTKIVAGVEERAKIVTEIAMASEEQSGAIAEINRSVDQVTQVVQQNSATAEQSAAASEEMSNQSTMLKDLVQRFRIRQQHTSFQPAAHSMQQIPARTSAPVPPPAHSAAPTPAPGGQLSEPDLALEDLKKYSL